MATNKAGPARRSAAAAGLVAFIFISPILHARDWPEPAAALFPRPFRAAADMEYNHQTFSGSDEDEFQFNLIAAVGLFGIGDRVNFGLRYGAFLMNGPVLEGDVPGSRLQWMMNAVQFAYGVHAFWDLEDIGLLAEYSRASQHPFRESFSRVSYDRVLIGVGRPGGPWGPFDSLVLSARAGYVDLFDIWRSDIGKPRTAWLFRLALSAEWRPGPKKGDRAGPACFIESAPDIFILRGGGPDAALSARAGLRLRHPGEATAYDIYLDLFLSGNTEERKDRPTPVFLFGWGFRAGSAGRSMTEKS